MTTRVPILALVALISPALPVQAQTQEPLRPLRGYAGGGLIVAIPTGEFEDYVGTGWGAGGHFAIRLDPYGLISLRADGGFVNYGRERRRVCLSPTIGCRIEVDLTTSNDIAFLSIGPQLAVPGGPLQPYFNASIGFSYFATVSSVRGTGNSDEEDFARTTNFDDITFAWQAGTGLRVPLRAGRAPIFLDFGARYNINGQVEYLTEGGITDNPDGTININPVRSEANLLTFVIGASFGVRW